MVFFGFLSTMFDSCFQLSRSKWKLNPSLRFFNLVSIVWTTSFFPLAVSFWMLVTLARCWASSRADAKTYEILALWYICQLTNCNYATSVLEALAAWMFFVLVMYLVLTMLLNVQCWNLSIPRHKSSNRWTGGFWASIHGPSLTNTFVWSCLEVWLCSWNA